MDFWMAVVTIVTIGCVTGIITTAIDKLASNKRRRLEHELKAERKHAALTQRRVAELEEDNQLAPPAVGMAHPLADGPRGRALTPELRRRGDSRLRRLLPAPGWSAAKAVIQLSLTWERPVFGSRLHGNDGWAAPPPLH